MSLAAIIGFLTSFASVIVKFMDWLHEQKLVESGKTQQQLNDLRGQIHEVQLAIAAREAVRADVARNPDSLPEHDPFRRD